MKKLVLVIGLALALSSCEKETGCGIVDGWKVENSISCQYDCTRYYLYVIMDDGDRVKKQVTRESFFKFHDGDSICF